jgi:hypothetical protein
MKASTIILFSLNIGALCTPLLLSRRRGRDDDLDDDDDTEPPSPSDIDTFFSLCDAFLDTMGECGEEWISTEDFVVQGIVNMSDRIVYTETLILDEAKEIGAMADRIVDTEYLMSNLSAACLPMCETSVNTTYSPNVSGSKEESKKFDSRLLNPIPEKQATQLKDADSARKKFKTDPHESPDVHIDFELHELSSCSPLSAFNEVLNESLISFEVLCKNVTDGLQFMVIQIGAMADRIVGTECLIMDMSKQIGVMADRIVTTEELMANLTAECCLPLAGPAAASQQPQQTAPFLALLKSSHRLDHQTSRSKRSQDTPPECVNYTNFTDTDDTAASSQLPPATWNIALPSVVRSHQLSSEGKYLNLKPQSDGPMPCDTWWNPFCCAMEVMTQLMLQMIDDMASMGSQVIGMVESTALTIGILADDIVDIEHEIMEMSLVIGMMADDIVEIEAWGLEFAQSEFCSSSSSSSNVKPRRLAQRTRRYLLAKGHPNEHTPALLSSSDQREKHPQPINLDSIFGEFAAMVDMMMKMATTMETLMLDEMKEMSNVVDACNEMASQIVDTMEIIGDMTGQIDIMASRIVTTSDLMENLMSDCIPSENSARTLAINPTCSTPPLESGLCDFYPDCLEATKPCGPHGYALGYGLKYCEKFASNSTLAAMDSQGQEWVNSTLFCLQQALVPLVEGSETAENMTCRDIKVEAFSTHPACYTGGGGAVPTDPSVCFLPLQDLEVLLGVIDLKDLVSPLGIEQEVAVARICLEQLTHRGDCTHADMHESDEASLCGFWQQRSGLKVVTR